MVGLTGKVCRDVIIHAVFLERIITQIRPQHGHHTQLVRALKGCGDLFNLPTRLLRTKVNGRPDRHRTHVKSLLHAGVQRLVIFGGITQRLVVVELNEEWNAVRVATRHRSQHAVG
ncbi:hypothetical protein D3C78_1412750 [compost metagenome]